MGWTKGCWDQESGHLSQSFLVNSYVLEDYEKYKNRQRLSQKADRKGIKCASLYMRQNVVHTPEKTTYSAGGRS